MSERRDYEMSDEQYKRLVIALNDARNQPVMMIGGSTGPSLQETANRQWALLGGEMGFDAMSVRPIPGRSERWFSAIPVKLPLPGRGRINIVVNGPPPHEAGRPIEVEDQFGAPFKVGEWVQEGERWFLVLP